MVVPMFEYTFDLDALVAGFEEAIALDSVTTLTPASDGFSIRTRGGAWVGAANVVVATPSDVAARLLELGPVKRPISAHMFLVQGPCAAPGRRPPTASFRRATRSSRSPGRAEDRRWSARRPAIRTSHVSSAPARSSSTTTGLPRSTSGEMPSSSASSTGPLPDRRPQRLRPRGRIPHRRVRRRSDRRRIAPEPAWHRAAGRELLAVVRVGRVWRVDVTKYRRRESRSEW